MSTEIKNTLFSFVTMRSPELSEKKEKNLGFIERPLGMNGFFDNVVSLEERTKVETLQKEIEKQKVLTAAFGSVVKTENGIVSMNPKIFDFGIWIAKNKTNYNVLTLKF